MYIWQLMKRHLFILLILCAGMWSDVSAQKKKVWVTGQVYGMNNTTDLLTLFVVSQANQTGNFGNPNGTYEILVDKNDTLLIGSIGYITQKICVKDSLFSDTIIVNVHLKQLEFYLKEVTVFAPRELRRIYDDIEKLGYDERDDRLSGVADPLSSPITALYERYNKHAQKERLARELMNDARRRDLLKELFRKYVDANIIDLNDDQFDEFIEYINVSDSFLQNSSQYDFIIFVKMKYTYFIKQHKYDGWEAY
ncbi:MAG: hypothetical protein ACI9GM_000168 [Salibacteraceae bacterium]|jgi:hypothetical protein